MQEGHTLPGGRELERDGGGGGVSSLLYALEGPAGPAISLLMKDLMALTAETMRVSAAPVKEAMTRPTFSAPLPRVGAPRPSQFENGRAA